jgi:hypothetical protein
MTEQNDPFKTANEPNYLAELVGEGKKFATIEDLAKGKWHSDTMIETLKAEIEVERQKANNGANVKALLDELKRAQGNNDDTNGQPNGQSQENPTPVNVEEIVLETLKKSKLEETIQSNKNKVINKITEVWGADAGKELKRSADALGISVTELNDIAQKSPEAFFRLTGLDADRTPSSGTTVPTSTVRLGGPASKVRDAKFYRELKQSNPKLYNDPKTKVQMHRDAIDLGEAYFN